MVCLRFLRARRKGLVLGALLGEGAARVNRTSDKKRAFGGTEPPCHVFSVARTAFVLANCMKRRQIKPAKKVL
jgi:hypothetical protein